jgi:hypothetical protein
LPKGLLASIQLAASTMPIHQGAEMLNSMKRAPKKAAVHPVVLSEADVVPDQVRAGYSSWSVGSMR